MHLDVNNNMGDNVPGTTVKEKEQCGIAASKGNFWVD